MKPAVHPRALADYHAGVESESTTMVGQLARVSPIWSFVVDSTDKHCTTLGAVFRALGVDAHEVASARRRIESKSPVSVRAIRGTMVDVEMRGVISPMGLELVAALVFSGVLTLESGIYGYAHGTPYSERRTRTSPREKGARKQTLEILSSKACKNLNDAQRLMARDVCEAFEFEESSGREMVDYLHEELGEAMVTLLRRFLHNGEGIETIEKEMGWSARSGKVVLSVALTLLVHRRERRAAT